MTFIHAFFLFHFSCWLQREPSYGAFVGPGSIFLISDLIIFCYLHALTNRAYPDRQDDIPDDVPQDKSKCSAKICKYRIKPKTLLEKTFPRRIELLCFMRGSLLLMLFYCLSFTFLAMTYMFKSQDTTIYLYYIFIYASSFCNVAMVLSLFYYHCIKHSEVRDFIHRLFKKVLKREEEETLLANEDEPSGEASENTPDAIVTAHSPTITIKSININGEAVNANGNIEQSDHIDEDSLPIVTVEPISTRVETSNNLKTHFSSSPVRPPTSGLDSDCNMNNSKANMEESQVPSKSQNQTSASEQERLSNAGQNSIGDCSLTSSKNNRKSRPVNPDIPENLRSFVPENWKPAQRRRKPKNGSYYPYFLNEPAKASVAYNSAGSSVSTNISGVPLYVNKRQAINNFAVYNERFNKSRDIAHQFNRMGPIQQPLPPQNYAPNIPIRLPQGSNPYHQYSMSSGPVTPNVSGIQRSMMLTPHILDYRGGYVTSDGSVTNKSETYPKNNYQQELSNDNIREINKVEEENRTESESEEEAPPIQIAPILYIPVPHVTRKQFILREETPC